MIAAFALLVLFILAPIPFLRSKRHKRSLLILAALVGGLLLFGLGAYHKRTELQSVALFFGLMGWFRLASEFDAKHPDE